MKRSKKIVPGKLTPDKALRQLGEKLKQARIKKGYSSYEYFAYENNLSRSQIGRYERGEDLRFSTLIKIINALGLNLKEFFSEGFD